MTHSGARRCTPTEAYELAYRVRMDRLLEESTECAREGGDRGRGGLPGPARGARAQETLVEILEEIDGIQEFKEGPGESRQA